MGESESLYGGLDCSTVYTAQSVLQLQKLLQKEATYEHVSGESEKKGVSVIKKNKFKCRNQGSVQYFDIKQ